MRWSLGQWVTFFFFYTVPGLVLMTMIGVLMWMTLPIWIVLTLLILWSDRK